MASHWSQFVVLVLVLAVSLSQQAASARRLLQAPPSSFFPGFPGLTAPSIPRVFPPLFPSPDGSSPFPNFPRFPGINPLFPTTPQLPGNPTVPNAPQFPGNPTVPNVPQFPGNPTVPVAPELPGTPASLPNAPAAPAFTPPQAAIAP